MGLLYDLAPRSPDRFEIEDTDRPTPELDIHRRFHHHEHAGDSGLPTSYCEAFWDRPDVELIAAADRDTKRLDAFHQRYGIDGLFTDAEKMLREERPELVAVATNTRTRADLTVLATECGARGIVTEKPMAHTLAEVDRMVLSCAQAGIPLSCGSITTTHPSFARARELLQDGAIGELLSIEAPNAGAQHQNWAYFLDVLPDWVVGVGDTERRESGSDEFVGTGMAWSQERRLAVHFRPGAPGVRLCGASGEMIFDYTQGWRLWQQVDAPGGPAKVEVPWPTPQFQPPYGAVYTVADVVDGIDGRLDEPKNSGRRVGIALEVEVALKQSSAQGGGQVTLPLVDRGLGLNYDWFR
jgi:hypothetical protein